MEEETVVQEKELNAFKDGLLGFLSFNTKYVLPWGVAAAGIVFLCGFGALCVFWFLGDYSWAERGLFYYKAATWGDGLFLSVGAGGIVIWLLAAELSKIEDLSSGRPTCRELFQSLLSGAWTKVLLIVLLGVGVAWQASWLISDTTVLNWTIPEVHHFNAPGWYHAFYFVCSIAFYGIGSFLIIRERLCGCCRPSSSMLVAETLISFSFCGYLAMHLVDNYADLFPGLWAAIAAFIIVVAVKLALLMASCGAFRTCKQESLSASISGCLAAAGVSSVVVSEGLEFSLLLVVATVQLLVVAPTVETDPRKPWGWRALSLFIASFGPALVLQCMPPITRPSDISFEHIVFFGSVCAFFYAVHLSRGMVVHLNASERVIDAGNSVKDQGRHTVGLLLSWTTLLYAAMLKVGISSNTIEIIAYNVLLVLAIACARKSIEPIKYYEDHCQPKDPNLTLLQMRTYAQLLMAAGGLVEMMFFQLYYGFQGAYIAGPSESQWIHAKNWPLSVAFSILCVLLIAAYRALRISESNKGSNSSAGIWIIPLVAAYAALYLTVTGCRMPYLSNHILTGIGVVLSVGASVYTANGYLSNCCTLRGLRVDAATALEAGVIALGCIFTAFGSIIPTSGAGKIWFPTIDSPIIGGVVLAVAFFIIPWVCADTYTQIHREEYDSDKDATKNKTVSGVCQDGASAAIMTLLMGTFSYEYLMVSILQTDSLTSFLALVSLVIQGYSAMHFPLKNNSEHLLKRMNEWDNNHPSSDADSTSLYELALHLHRQAILVFCSLLPWSLTYLILPVVMENGDSAANIRKELLLDVRVRKWPLLFKELLPMHGLSDEAAEYASSELKLLGRSRD